MEAGYFALSVKPLDKLDFCQFSATNAVLILLMSWISSPPSVRFRLCRNSNPSILSSTGLKLGPSRGKFTGTPATRHPWTTNKIGYFVSFLNEFSSSSVRAHNRRPRLDGTFDHVVRQIPSVRPNEHSPQRFRHTPLRWYAGSFLSHFH